MRNMAQRSFVSVIDGKVKTFDPHQAMSDNAKKNRSFLHANYVMRINALLRIIDAIIYIENQDAPTHVNKVGAELHSQEKGEG